MRKILIDIWKRIKEDKENDGIMGYEQYVPFYTDGRTKRGPCTLDILIKVYPYYISGQKNIVILTTYMLNILS